MVVVNKPEQVESRVPNSKKAGFVTSKWESVDQSELEAQGMVTSSFLVAIILSSQMDYVNNISVICFKVIYKCPVFLSGLSLQSDEYIIFYGV